MKKLIESDNDILLEKMKDIRDILDMLKIPGNYIPPEKYLNVRDFLHVCANIRSKIISLLPEEDNLYQLVRNIFVDKLLIHHIESIIDNTGAVKDNATKNLLRIRTEIITKKDTLRKLLDRILKRFSEQEYTQEDIITLRDGRSVIPVKSENKRKVPGIIHSSSATGYTVFIEPAETTELNNELTELHFEEIREVEKILNQLAREIYKFSDEIRMNCQIAGEIDWIRAKALFSINYECSQPEFESNQINIIEAYHPLLLNKLGKSRVTPLYCNAAGTANTIIVTGPNAGGKTVSLKTIGLLQVMLQCGLHIPVSPDSTFRVFDSVSVVIGDEQSIENDLSSFSSHLKELREVMNESCRNSLVLIDEICSGTDPGFGSALAISILEHLSANNAFTVVTTHNGNLKIYAEKNPRFINASLDFDFEKLSPSFRFRLGIPGQSFTFELAKKMNLPAEIIHKAVSFVSKDEYKIEETLKEMNKNKTQYENLKREYDSKLADLTVLQDSYRKKMSGILIREKEIISAAKIESRRILEDGRKLIEKAVKEIREKEKNIGAIKKEYSDASEQLVKTEKSERISNKNLKIGDAVIISGTDTRGTIQSIEGKTVYVNANSIVIKTDSESLEIVDNINNLKNYSENRLGMMQAFNPVLDIRGKYTNEVDELIENHIYEGHLNSMSEITIVHGKGTGKLKIHVHSILKNNKYIRKFRLGNWNEGDSGVTIVELIK